MLSTAYELYFTNVYAFSHAYIVWGVAFACGKRNMKAG
jgi:hypothetical protein